MSETTLSTSLYIVGDYSIKHDHCIVKVETF